MDLILKIVKIFAGACHLVMGAFSLFGLGVIVLGGLTYGLGGVWAMLGFLLFWGIIAGFVTRINVVGGIVIMAWAAFLELLICQSLVGELRHRWNLPPSIRPSEVPGYLAKAHEAVDEREAFIKASLAASKLDPERKAYWQRRYREAVQGWNNQIDEEERLSADGMGCLNYLPQLLACNEEFKTDVRETLDPSTNFNSAYQRQVTRDIERKLGIQD